MNKVVLAYSGGLDTSGIPHRIKERYGTEVIAFTEADEVHDQRDAMEFNRLNALRLRTLASKHISEGE